jgi:hypothetical protein
MRAEPGPSSKGGGARYSRPWVLDIALTRNFGMTVWRSIDE